LALLKTMPQRIAPLLALPLIALGCGSGAPQKQDMDIVTASAKPPRAPQIDFLAPEPIGNPPGDAPAMISHLMIVDLDQDGLMDVVFSDALAETVCWLRQYPLGTFTEKPLGDPIKGPTHLEAADMTGNGHLDILVASMGVIAPTNDEIGAVVILENDGEQNFTNRYIAEGIPRVTDVRAADLNGNGRLDLAVGQFGYDTGEIQWMENIGEGWIFRGHKLLNLSGTIHTPVADMDGDGNLDIVALVSQEWEEIYVFENDGKGNFTPHMVFGSTNEDFGSSGIYLADMDGDGDIDILYTNGDSFDYLPPGPRPWHGLQWLENKGNYQFEYHRIDDFAGASSAVAVDVNNNGHMDIVVTSSLNQDEFSTDASIIWFENDGNMNFTRRDIARDPALLVVIAPGDMDGDGRVDFVTGTFPSAPPADLKNRVTLWRNHWGEAAPAARTEARP